MSTKEIVELISVLVSLLVPLIGFITALVKIIKEKQWNILKSMLCDFMIKAEQTYENGADKKAAVLKWCEDFCRQQGINFNADQVSGAIETLIDLSKKINHTPEQTPEKTSQQTSEQAEQPNLSDAQKHTT